MKKEIVRLVSADEVFEGLEAAYMAEKFWGILSGRSNFEVEYAYVEGEVVDFNDPIDLEGYPEVGITDADLPF